MRELIVFLLFLSGVSALAGTYFSFMASTSMQEAKRKSYVALKSQANAMTFIFLSGLILSQSLILASNFTAPDVPDSALAETPTGLVVSEPSSGGQDVPGNIEPPPAEPPATIVAPDDPQIAAPGDADQSPGAQDGAPSEIPPAPENVAPPVEPVTSCAQECDLCSQPTPASCTGIQACTNETCSSYSQPCNVPAGTGCGITVVPCPPDSCAGSDYYDYPANDSCTMSCEGSGNCQSCTPSCTPAIFTNDTRCAGAPTANSNSSDASLTPDMAPPEISVPQAAPALEMRLNVLENIKRGDTFSFLVEITNVGSSGAKNATVEFTMPGGVSFESGEKSIGEISAGESIRREFIFKSDYGANLGASKIKVRMTYE